MGDMGVFGFYPNKQITTGEGGMVTTNNKEHYDYLFSARNQGRATDMQWLTHVRLGYNFRISEITAAIGVEQMKKLPDILRLRREKALLYNEALKDVPGIRLPKGWESEDHSWFVFAVRVEAKYRDEIIRLLNEQGVESKAYFYPCIHLQDFYMKDFGFKEGMFPIAEKLSKETLILPFFTSITEAEILYVKEKIVEAFASLRK